MYMNAQTNHFITESLKNLQKLTEAKHLLTMGTNLERRDKAVRHLVTDYYNSSAWSDVTVSVSGERIRCHRFVLATSWPYMVNVLKEVSAEDDVVLIMDDFPPEEVVRFLKCAYGHGDVQLDEFINFEKLIPKTKIDDVKEEPNIDKLDDFLSSMETFIPASGVMDDSYESDTDLEEFRVKKKKSKIKKSTKLKITPVLSEEPKISTSSEKKKQGERGGDRKPRYKKGMAPKHCDFCNKWFRDTPKRDRHMRVCKSNPDREKIKREEEAGVGCDFFCDMCGKAFMSNKRLKEHQQSHETQDVQCQIEGCLQVIFGHRKYREHMLVIHQKVIGIEVDLSSISTSGKAMKEKPVKKFLCNECGKEFTSRSAHLRHVKKHNGLLPEVVCTICGQKLADVFSLRNHMANKHQTERPFPCPFCDQTFKQDKNLKLHIREKHVADDQKRYQCSMCPRGFVHKQSFEAHLNSHTNNKPYKCQYCTNAYQNDPNLRAHMRKHHLDKIENRATSYNNVVCK